MAHTVHLDADILNKMSDDLIRVNPIHTDKRDEITNTRVLIVTVKENENYALIHKENGQTFYIKHYQNVLSALVYLASIEMSPEATKKAKVN